LAPPCSATVVRSRLSSPLLQTFEFRLGPFAALRLIVGLRFGTLCPKKN
jgi:hypothetical protein